MTTLGIISDTHVFDGGKGRVPDFVFELFGRESVSQILHGGDIVAWSLIEKLEEIAPVAVVRGNNDPASYALPCARLLRVENLCIGLAHGDVPGEVQGGVAASSVKPLRGIRGNGITAANALSHFANDAVSCVVFGHSHNPLSHVLALASREVLLFNPGSPTDKRYAPNFSVGLLRVNGDHIKAELHVW